jgi:hypothetical protein
MSLALRPSQPDSSGLQPASPHHSGDYAPEKALPSVSIEEKQFAAPEAPPTSDKQALYTSPPSEGLIQHNPADGPGYEPGIAIGGAEGDGYRSKKGRGNEQRRYCGMRRTVFWIVLAVVLLVIIGAAVGGGVGGALASKKSSDSALAGPTSSGSALPGGGGGSTTATGTDTSIATTASTPTSSPSASGMGTYECPASNGSTYTPSLASTALTFIRLCSVDWPLGASGISGGSVVDIEAVIATSMESCIDQCAAYSNANGGVCRAVTYGANITRALARGGISGNCFLKTQKGIKDLADGSGQEEGAYLASYSVG